MFNAIFKTAIPAIIFSKQSEKAILSNELFIICFTFTRSRKYKFSTTFTDVKTEIPVHFDESSNAMTSDFKPEFGVKNDEMYYENEEVIEEDDGVEADEKFSNSEEQHCIEVKTFQEDSADWYFLKSLMPDIQSLNPSQKRKLRIQILTLIDNIITEG